MQNILFFLSYFENYFLLVIFIIISIGAFRYGLIKPKSPLKSVKIWFSSLLVGIAYSFLLLRSVALLLGVLFFYTPFILIRNLLHPSSFGMKISDLSQSLLLGLITILFLYFYPLVFVVLGNITKYVLQKNKIIIKFPIYSTKKLLLFSVFFLSGLLFVYWRFFAYIPLDWKIYTNIQTTYHYSFAYPKDWIVSNCGNGEVVVAKKAIDKCYYPFEAKQDYLNTIYFQVFLSGNYQASSKTPEKLRNWKTYEPYDDNGAFLVVSHNIIPMIKTAKYDGFGPFLVGFFTHTNDATKVDNILLHSFYYPKNWFACSFTFICK